MLMIFMMIEDPKERTFLSRLYEEQSKHLFGIADHMLHNAADAEDAVQEVFLKLLSHKSIQQLASMQAEKRESCFVLQQPDL